MHIHSQLTTRENLFQNVYKPTERNENLDPSNQTPALWYVYNQSVTARIRSIQEAYKKHIMQKLNDLSVNH